MSLLIVVCRARRRLEAYRDGEVILACHASLGFGADDGPKTMEGDGRTPVGEYYVCTKNAASKFGLSLGVSYPGPEDAARARAEGRVDDRDAERIAAACRAGLRPPWDTPLGGYIMIHGQRPEGHDESDWTAGCAAIADHQMRILFSLARIGDLVRLV